MNSTKKNGNSEKTFYNNEKIRKTVSTTQLKPFIYQNTSAPPPLYLIVNNQQCSIQNTIPKDMNMKTSLMPSYIPYNKSFNQPVAFQNPYSLGLKDTQILTSQSPSPIDSLPVPEAQLPTTLSPSMENSLLLPDIQKSTLRNSLLNLKIKNSILQAILDLDVNNDSQLKILYLIDYIIKKNEKALNIKKTDNTEESMMKFNNQIHLSNDNNEEKNKIIFPSALEQSLKHYDSELRFNKEPIICSSSSSLSSSSSSSNSNISLNKELDELKKEHYLSFYKHNGDNGSHLGHNT